MKNLVQSLSTVALLSALTAVSPAFSQHEHGEEGEGHAHNRSESHGGASTMTEDFHFETVFHDDQIVIYVYDGSQNPVDAQGVTGTVEIAFRDRGRQPLNVELRYVSSDSEQVGSLQGDVDLSGVADGQAKATIELQGLSGRTEKDVSFRETFRLAPGGEEGHGHGGQEDHDDDHGHG